MHLKCLLLTCYTTFQSPKMADIVEEVPAKEEEVESGDDDESDADSIPELEETEAGAGGRKGSITPYEDGFVIREGFHKKGGGKKVMG